MALYKFSTDDNVSACLGHLREVLNMQTCTCFCSCSITDVWAFNSFNIDGNNETFFLFELKLYLALGLFSKLFESTSEEPYNSRREVLVVVV